MNILILEDEIYLAQKVAARLLDEGHNCDNFTSISEVNPNSKYDTILVSTNLSNGNFENIIKKYKDSIIILLVSYISDATVTNPIKAGADDYVLKPFIMNELIRKIHHYEQFKKMKKEIAAFQDYFKFIFDDINLNITEIPNKFPLLIETNDQKYADKFTFTLSQNLRKNVKFISLAKQDWQNKVEECENNLLYLTDFHTLKKSGKEQLLKSVETLTVIICSLENEDNFLLDDIGKKIAQKIEIKNSNQLLSNDNIMTINDYVKLIVTNFQTKYPDTELSKKLGISRKSLWEKRKKLNIIKKK